VSESHNITTTTEQQIWLPAREAGILLRASKKSLHKNRNRYITKQAIGNGGTQYLFLLSSLPGDVQAKYLQTIQPTSEDGHTSFLPVTRSSFSAREQGTYPPPAPSSHAIPEKLKAVALARYDLVTAWQAHRLSYIKSKRRLKADDDFESVYNSGLLLPVIFERLGRVDITTVKRWHRKLEGTRDWTRLVPEWNCRKQEPSLAQEEKKIFQNCLLHPNRLSIGEATRITKVVLKKRGIGSPSSDRTFRRWAEWFMSKNGHIWTLMREGQKALIDKEVFSIERDISKLAVGDVLVADGHKLDFQVKHPFTGKPVRATILAHYDWKSSYLVGYEIMIEENTQCITSSLRNSIVHLGKIPKISYQDNGKAFKGKFFTEETNLEECGFYGLFGRLGIIPVFAMKYHARSKVIERFWKEFIGKFERLLPSFTGASVDDKPAWTRMGETFHKAIHNGYIPTIKEAKSRIDAWIEDYLEVQPCPHVKGKTIGEVFREGQGPGVDVEELDELMLATEVKTIRAGTITFLSGDYEHENLFGLHESVYVKYSLFDLSFIKVYDRAGNYLCTATRKALVHPMAQHLGAAKDVTELRYQQNKQRTLARNTMKAAKELIAANKKAALPWADIIEVNPRVVEQLEKADIELPACEREIPEGAYKAVDDAPALKDEISRHEEQPSSARPYFGPNDDLKYYQWLIEHGPETDYDREWLQRSNECGIGKMMAALKKDREEWDKSASFGKETARGRWHGAGLRSH
jgi:putative transposase